MMKLFRTITSLFILLFLFGCDETSVTSNDNEAESSSSDSSLSNLALSSGSLDQIFQSAQFDYTAGVLFLQSTVTLIPTATDPKATITVNGNPVTSGTASPVINLGEGENIVEVLVTATDNLTTSIYVITIARQSADNFTQQAYLKASNAGQNDQFGASVALDGDTLVIGAPREDGDGSTEASNDANSAGAAYVFRNVNGVWKQEAYLKASNADTDAATGSQFGISVDISGDTIVVGAPQERTLPGVDGLYTDVGAAYVFSRNGNDWREQALLKASNASGRDAFGTSVSIDGDTIAVGAWGESSAITCTEKDDSLTWSGAAYIFVRSNDEWIQQACLKASNASMDDRFGSSLEINGDAVVIGAPFYGTDDTGAAYVFMRTQNIWSQQAFLRASNPQSFTRFGSSVSIDANTLAVGAYLESNDGFNNSGGAYVFGYDGSAWGEEQHLLASDIAIETFFGSSIKVRGDLIAVGAPAATVSATAPGSVYLFSKEADSWIERIKFTASNAEPFDAFGTSIDFDEENLVAGSRYEDSSATGGESDNSEQYSGAGYVFQ